MSDEIMNAQPGQVGDLGGNAVQQNVSGTQQASVNVQSPDNWAEREKEILAKAYQQTQSLISKSENRQSNNFQSMIDQFKRDYGVTLTPEQAQEMAQNQAAKSGQNAPVTAQAQAQKANATDASYQGFKYYFGMTGSQNDSLYRQCFDVQRALGVELEKSDEEYQKLAHPETKYKPQEFVAAWRQACINKLVRLQSARQEGTDKAKPQTNLGQMPVVGAQGSKPTSYDPKRTGKSYLSAYLKDKIVT